MGGTIDEEIRLVTAALPYVNNVPHIGNVVGSHLPADIFARYCRLKGYKTLFIGGSDEHGTPTEVTAFKLGVDPERVVDFYYKIHKEIYDWFEFSYDNFSRTSKSKLHYKVTKEFFLTIFRNGYIIEKEQILPFDPEAKKMLPDRYVIGKCPYCGYEKARGDQCEACGRLLDPTELINPVSILTKKPVTFKKTRHLFLDLRRLEEPLKKWLIERKGIFTDQSLSIALSWIKEGLKPRSITRDLKWGVPVPYKELWEIVKEKIKIFSNLSKEEFVDFLIEELRKLRLVVPEEEIQKIKSIVEEFWPDIDKIFENYNYFEIYKDKVLYVWFDAPIGYLSFTIECTENWADFWCNPKAKIYHFIGKDNIPFHTIFWPGMILAFNDKAIGLVKVLEAEPNVETVEGVTIEEIEEKDLEEVYNLSKKFAEEVPGAKEDTPGFIKECDIKLKALVDGKIVGYILGKLYPDYFLVIESLYVLPEYRRKGIGIMLVKALEKETFKKGYKKIYAPAATDHSYNLFKKLGYEFAKEGIIVNYKLNLPYNVVGLQYLNYEGRKISKSQNWGVFCENLPETGLDPDYWRFYLSLLIPENRDTEFTWKGFEESINKELVGNLVNFMYRVLSFAWKNYNGDLSDVEPEEETFAIISEYSKEIERLFEEVRLVEALKKILELSSLGNKLFQERKPWENPEDSKSFIKSMLYLVRAIAILISPYTPNLSKKVADILGFELKWDEMFKKDIGNVRRLEILLRKLNKEDVEELKQKTTKVTDFEKDIKQDFKKLKKMGTIKFEDFMKMDLRIGKVIEVSDHPNADKLYVIKVDLGNEVRTIVAGLKDYYKPEDLLNKKIVIITNLKPKKIRGIESQGMLLAAEDENTVAILVPDKDIKEGARVH